MDWYMNLHELKTMTILDIFSSFYSLDLIRKLQIVATYVKTEHMMKAQKKK